MEQTNNDWVKEMAALTKPDEIVWIDGTEGEETTDQRGDHNR